jgi:hypothetical protein
MLLYVVVFDIILYYIYMYIINEYWYRPKLSYNKIIYKGRANQARNKYTRSQKLIQNESQKTGREQTTWETKAQVGVIIKMNFK